jgi:hypothetical protein
MHAIVFRGHKILIKEIAWNDVLQGSTNNVGGTTIPNGDVLRQDIEAMIELLTLG